MLTVLPRSPTDKIPEVAGYDRVHRGGELIARLAPVRHVAEAQVRPAAAKVQLAFRGEVLVGDGVAPPVEPLKPNASARSPSIKLRHRRPQAELKAVEVGADVPRRRVARVELPALAEPVGDDRPDPRIGESTHDLVHSFGVKIAAEPLEM